MGRYDTGAITTGGCLQIKISSFTQYIKTQTSFTALSFSWSNGASIKATVYKKEDRYFLELHYTKGQEGNKQEINYKVPIVSTPSNLGKGEVYYFICPFSGKRCKTLYMGYGSLYFKSREAYSHRIYYASQISSYLNKHNDTYWRLEKRIEVLRKKCKKKHYRGKQTALQVRIKAMREKQAYHDKMRWEIIPKALSKSLAMYGLTDAREMF